MNSAKPQGPEPNYLVSEIGSNGCIDKITRRNFIICTFHPTWAGIKYSDTLRTGRSGDGIPVWTNLSAPVKTGPGAHRGSCTMGNRSFSRK